MILGFADLSCLLVASVKTSDRKVRFRPSSAVAVQPPLTLNSPVRTPHQEEYEEQMCPPSVGGAGGGARCYRCATHPSILGHKATGDYLGLVQSDLAHYRSVPLNGWERPQLVNFLLLPRWLHRLLPSDKTLHQIDTVLADFLWAPKGMEATMNHYLLGTPPEEGGMGCGRYAGLIDANT